MKLEDMVAEGKQLGIDITGLSRKEASEKLMTKKQEMRKPNSDGATAAEDTRSGEPTDLSRTLHTINQTLHVLTQSIKVSGQPLTLTKMQEKDDLRSFIHAFEVQVRAARISPRNWGRIIGTYLTGAALDVYYKIPIDELDDFDTVIEHLLRKTELTPESYRAKIVRGEPRIDQTYVEWGRGINDQIARWQISADVPIQDLLLPELYISIWKTNPNKKGLLDFIQMQTYKTFEEFLMLCDRYIAWQELSKARDHGKKSGRENKKTGGKFTKKPVRCYDCRELGHLARDCPKKNKKTYKQALPVELEEAETKSSIAVRKIELELKGGSKSDYVLNGLINGQAANMYCDSGADITLVREKFINIISIYYI